MRFKVLMISITNCPHWKRSQKHLQFCEIWTNMKISNNPAKYEVLSKQYLTAVLDTISTSGNTMKRWEKTKLIVSSGVSQLVYCYISQNQLKSVKKNIHVFAWRRLAHSEFWLMTRSFPIEKAKRYNKNICLTRLLSGDDEDTTLLRTCNCL